MNNSSGAWGYMGEEAEMARLPTLKSLPLMGTAREPPPSDEVSRGEGGQLCRLCGKAKQERFQSDSRKDRSSSGSAARGWVPDQERHHSWRSFWGARGRREGKAAGQSGLGAESWDGHVWGPQAPPEGSSHAWIYEALSQAT